MISGMFLNKGDKDGLHGTSLYDPEPLASTVPGLGKVAGSLALLCDASHHDYHEYYI